MNSLRRRFAMPRPILMFFGSYETRALELATGKGPSRFYRRNSTNEQFENKKVLEISSKTSAQTTF